MRKNREGRPRKDTKPKPNIVSSKKHKGTLARVFDLIAALPDDFEIPGKDKDWPQKRKGLVPSDR